MDALLEHVDHVLVGTGQAAGTRVAGLTRRDLQRPVLVHPTVSELMPWVEAALAPVE